MSTERTERRTISMIPWVLALCVAACGASCALRSVQPAVEPPPEQQPVHPEPAVVEPPAPAPPSEADLAMQAASDAEARGDYETALDLYGWAAVSRGADDRVGEIHYRRGMLYADPETGMLDPAQARREFEAVTGALPRSGRYREARVMLSLLGDLAAARDLSVLLRAEIDALKADVASLRSDLVKKEQELNSIKQVLLQKNP